MCVPATFKGCRRIVVGQFRELVGGLVLCVLFGVLSAPELHADVKRAKLNAAHVEFFETEVRPLLVEYCFQCHSRQSETVQGGLYLDHGQGVGKGGYSGPVVVAGDPDESLLIQAVRYQSVEMPPDNKLSDAQIEVLVRWVRLGAPWPSDKGSRLPTSDKDYDWPSLQQDHWAWRPVLAPVQPSVTDNDWPMSDIDYYVLAKLEEAGLQPAPPAEDHTLLRRVFFDLIGLSPQPVDIQGYEQDRRPDRFAQLVDRLLASPQYGERWGRHWLDVARYSDGMGGFTNAQRLPKAYRYRDWVVRALNRDVPYDLFVRLQIAGDIIDSEDSVIGPGFFALGPTYRDDGGDVESKAKTRSETLDDRIDTLSRGILGLTVACARCHDHKFDPIPTRDYYSLAGVFNNTKLVDAPLVSQRDVQDYKDAQQAIKEKQDTLKKVKAELTKNGRQPTAQENESLAVLAAQIKSLKDSAPPMYPVAHSLADTGDKDMAIALRGDLRKPGPVAPRRFLRILKSDHPKHFQRGSGRLDLADEVVDPDNPLTARVMVNRIWLHHFGAGLVRTPSNFGTLGELPTHPDLLDWLAHRFVRFGWSIKRLHREIMCSATYQMSSRYDEANFRQDGDNRLLWRMTPRRLDVEAWRDALLSVSGDLDCSIGGPPTEQLLQSQKRTLYTVISRSGDRFGSDHFLRLFDFPSPQATSAKRTISTVPQQFLFMMNSPFMIARAQSLARRLAEQDLSDEERIHFAHRLLFGRPAAEEELHIAMEFLHKNSDNTAKLTPWQLYAQGLLCSNQFLFVQ